ncbi:MAG: hypothetical protein AAF602_20980 [Myxococcota bacterium]
MLQAFPLLIVPILIYNVFAFIGDIPGVEVQETWCSPAVHIVCCELQAAFIEVPMIARFPADPGELGVRAVWPISMSDLLMALGLVMLFFELMKSTQIQQSSLVNHALSLLLFIAGLIEFLLLPQFATSTFFFLIIMALLDVLAGFIVTIASARRDVALEV